MLYPPVTPPPGSKIAWAEFQEKEFETAANFELRYSRILRNRVYASNQMSEAVLGYDAIANPTRANRIWKIVRQTKPKGIVLRPEHWGVQDTHTMRDLGLPNRITSLVMQYKRPEVVRSGSRTPQRHLWDNQEYLRFRIDNPQHRVLQDLERKLGTHVLIKYCAPAFHTNDDLYSYMDRRQVLHHSTTVSPIAPDNSEHKYWTYQSSDAVGRWNPGGSEVFGNSLASTVSVSVEANVGSSVSEHLGTLARSAIVNREVPQVPISAWVDALNLVRPGFREYALETGVPYQPPSDEQIQARRALATFGVVDSDGALPVDDGFELMRSLILVASIDTMFTMYGLSWYVIAAD